MSLSVEQLRHDRINLGRLIKRLEEPFESWIKGNGDEEAWVKINIAAQRIRYARQLLLNVDGYDDLNLRVSSSTLKKKQLEYFRETLDRLDRVIDAAKQRLTLQTTPLNTSYLSLVALPEEITSSVEVPEGSPEVELIPAEHPAEADLLPISRPLERPQTLPSQAQSSSVFSASLQTHEELSAELARMAEQLKRNTQYFSESLGKDKALVQTAAEVLDKNYDSLSKERQRLKTHSGKSFWTTWIAVAAVLIGCIAWIIMFIIIRIT